mmetsp:Transcript_16890/g.24455  ORF Transcript_16890/g.24455 Transcript_16890/m.24455 type:complete len:92 (+) Transcript_16890:2696-2971(+)
MNDGTVGGMNCILYDVRCLPQLRSSQMLVLPPLATDIQLMTHSLMYSGSPNSPPGCKFSFLSRGAPQEVSIEPNLTYTRAATNTLPNLFGQ